jgi:hypothetical protein
MGLCEGVTFPAISSMMARWAPVTERSIMSTLIMAGSQVDIIRYWAYWSYWLVTDCYTVKKAQRNFQLENHVTFHVIGIKIVYNVNIIYISADVKLNSIEFTRFYIVHNVI